MPVPSTSPVGTAQPDVWLLIAGCSRPGTAIAIVRLGPRFAVPGRPVVTRFQVTCWALGVLDDVARVRLARPRSSPSGTTSASTWCSTCSSRWSPRRCCCSAPPAGSPAGCCGRRPRSSARCARCRASCPRCSSSTSCSCSRTGRWLVNESLSSGLVHFSRARGAVRVVAHRVDAGASARCRRSRGSPHPCCGCSTCSCSRSCRRCRRRSSRSAARRSTSSTRRPAPLRAVDARGPAGRGSDHEDRCRTPTLGTDRRSVLPLGCRGGTRQRPQMRRELDQELARMGLRR